MQNFTLTPLVQTAITVLYDIADGESSHNWNIENDQTLNLTNLLPKLEAKGLIRLKDSHVAGDLTSYELALPTHLITLLDIIEAVGEPIDYEYFIPQLHSIHETYPADKEAVKRMIHGYLETFKLAHFKRSKEA